MKTYWMENDFKKLEQVQSFSDIGAIALDVQMRMPNNLGQVCGPISTGGKGTIEENTRVFIETIDALTKQDVLLYNQMPLESAMVKIIKQLGDAYNPYDLLEDIYGPLFDSGKIRDLYFIYDWESSLGSRWEYKKGYINNMNITYLEEDFHENNKTTDKAQIILPYSL